MPTASSSQGWLNGARSKAGATVPRALERARERDLRPFLQLVEPDRDGPGHVAADPETPRAGIDVRDVEVDEEVVKPERRDVVAQGLERQAVITRRQGELDGREV